MPRRAEHLESWPDTAGSIAGELYAVLYLPATRHIVQITQGQVGPELILSFAKTPSAAKLCLLLSRPIGLTPPAAGIGDAVHRRAAPPPPCPRSGPAHPEARVRP